MFHTKKRLRSLLEKHSFGDQYDPSLLRDCVTRIAASRQPAASTQQIDDYHHRGRRQNQMDQASSDTETEAEQPQDQENRYDCPKHVDLPCSLLARKTLKRQNQPGSATPT